MNIGTAIIKAPKDISKGKEFVVKFIIIHPMEPGTRKDPKTNQLIPINHLTSIKISYDGKEVSEITAGTGVSTNPTFGIMMKVEKSGVLKLSYKDNKGGNWEKTEQITVS